MRIIIFLCIVLVSELAQADNSNTNRQILPIGESEAFLGNAGTGRAHDTGAVYYNPAGLTELSSGRVSMSGSVYLSFTTETDAAVHVDNTDVAYKASGFNTIPAFYVATYRLSDSVTGALSVLVPNSIQIENRVPFTTPQTESNIIQNFRSSDLWVGASLAHRFDDQLSIGFSVYGIQHQEAQTLALDMAFPAQRAQNLITSLSQENLSIIGLSAIFGVEYRANSLVSVGLRAQTPLIQLSGSADTYQQSHQFSDGKVATTGEEKQGVPAAYRLPFDFTLGTTLSPTAWLAFLADVSLQLGTHYDSIPGSELSESVNLKPTARFNLGLELRPEHDFPVRLGFYYNPSATGVDPSQAGYISEDYYGITGGVGFNSTKVETSLGAFYLWSKGKTVPVGGNGDSASVKSHCFGVLLTASYLL